MSARRRGKSAAWRRRQEADGCVRSARAAGYRSRAAYKLLEIDREHRLLRRGGTVVDLGAAPGSWSQVVMQKIGDHGRLVAVDLLPLLPLPNVCFIQGDFNEAAVRREVAAALGGAADVVVSDMSPNLSGIAVRDQANAQALFSTALAFCTDGGLKKGGDFLVKAFAGEAYEECRCAMQPLFASVKVIIPAATRKNSRECYLLGSELTRN